MWQASTRFYHMLENRQFDELDQAANEARETSATTSDGQPLIKAMYEGTAGCECPTAETPELWEQRRQWLRDWRNHTPGSVNAEVASIFFHIAYARGLLRSNYRRDQEESVMKLFALEISTAYAQLQRASKAARGDPQWYYAMLEIGLAQHWQADRFDAVFKEAVRKYPGYTPLYFAAASYHSKYWYGSDKEWREFLDQAVEISRALLGYSIYARLAWSMDMNERALLDENGPTPIWKKMKAGFERLTTDFPDDWNLNNYAKFSCRAHDAEAIFSLAARIGDHILPEVWKGELMDFPTCVLSTRRTQEMIKRSGGPAT
ncbi:MAG: cytoplasmic protein [Betaproteobacteria bacterium]|nr:cytoplasmic protein [Betaproteobacteria bacterium]